MWRNSAMAEPSTRPEASGTFTRRKLGETLYLRSWDFYLRDPNCHLMKPTYHSLHDPHLNQHLHRKHIHNNLKDRNLITGDDMVVCSRKEYSMYWDYVDDVKNDIKNKQQRERQKKFLELEEQGLISDSVTGEDIRTFIRSSELPRHDKSQQQHGLEQTKKSTKRTIKEKDGLLNGRQLPSITTPQTSAPDRTRLHLIENEIKHELNRKRYMRDIQEKRSQREKSIFEHRAAAQQAEVDTLTKTLRELENMRVHTKVQTKLLNQVLGNSTSGKRHKIFTLGATPSEIKQML
ncbi:fibrous sheath-interacting protein 2-like isoform X3 [Alosa sapidissima]|uniref:fibrous sheath-interacting protein 2-like isoform X3 n=1 Tax=Alosa sapidissima TaxID=34773 RepID=UPI001C0A19CC|nr:fibrous sheath-interacting protein 2-like isoform X3 [Alosa sapidissima]